MYTGNLFRGKHIHDFISDIENSLTNEVKNLKTLNFDSDKSNLIKKYKLGPLILLNPVPLSEPERIESITEGYGYKSKSESYSMKIGIPFLGNSNLFSCSPMTYSHNYPNIDEIDSLKKIIEFTINIRDTNEALYKSAVNSIFNDINENVKHINADVLNWDETLSDFIDSQLNKQKLFIENKNDFYEKIGLTKNLKADEYITPSPITRKKIPQPKIDNTKTIKKVAPILQDVVYKDILNTLYYVGKAIEKKPSIYIGKSEPDLRDILILFLETRYESTTATGETFNKKGKADIVLKYSEDASNLFVAECKIWSGPSDFIKAIDQLLGYLTLRDSQSALLVFVDNKNIIKTKEQILMEIKNHKSFKCFVNENDEFSIRYKFCLPDDPDVNIELEVMLFHFPERKSL